MHCCPVDWLVDRLVKKKMLVCTFLPHSSEIAQSPTVILYNIVPREKNTVTVEATCATAEWRCAARCPQTFRVNNATYKEANHYTSVPSVVSSCHSFPLLRLCWHPGGKWKWRGARQASPVHTHSTAQHSMAAAVLVSAQILAVVQHGLEHGHLHG